jgi:hypothetical protein
MEFSFMHFVAIVVNILIKKLYTLRSWGWMMGFCGIFSYFSLNSCVLPSFLLLELCVLWENQWFDLWNSKWPFRGHSDLKVPANKDKNLRILHI